MVLNAEGLTEHLVGWIKLVAKSFKKDKLSLPVTLSSSMTTADKVLVALAEKTGIEIDDRPRPVVLEDDVLALASFTADNYIAARSNKRRGGVCADALPLASLHESEIMELARHLKIFPSTAERAIEAVDPRDVERAIGITAALTGSTKGDDFFHVAKTLSKFEIATPEFINVLKEVGKNEMETRFRHNGNIPVPNIRQEGLDYVV